MDKVMMIINYFIFLDLKSCKYTSKQYLQCQVVVPRKIWKC